jgi:Arc/MetJ-type ribon-helix-helix transcriptional regulator
MVKRTFSITLSSELKGAMDQEVTEGRFFKRSQAIEHYLRRGYEEEKRERELLNRRQSDLNKIWEQEQGKLDFMLAFFEATERHPEILETMREAMRRWEGR